MKILFWNTKRNKNINPYIVNLVCDHEVDVLVVAEYRADAIELGYLFQESRTFLEKCNTLGCDRLDIWSSYKNIEAGLQDSYYSIQIISNEYILCGVHMITDLHGDRSDERLLIAQQIMHDVQKTEEKIKSQKTIIVGDMNEMPYGKSCLNANGFHGLPALNISDKSTRKVNKREYRKFYNPMWNLLGDFEYPPGTYYLNQSKLHSPMWYMLDQVMISMDVLPLFHRERLKIITSGSLFDLKDSGGHPNKKISDHFPIICEIG